MDTFQALAVKDNGTVFIVTQRPFRGRPIPIPCGGRRQPGRTPIRTVHTILSMLEISLRLYLWSSTVARRVLVGRGTLMLGQWWQSSILYSSMEMITEQLRL